MTWQEHTVESLLFLCLHVKLTLNTRNFKEQKRLEEMQEVSHSQIICWNSNEITPSFLPSSPKIGQLSKPPLNVFSWSPPKNPIFKWTPIILKLFILKKFRSREVPLFENLVWGSTPSPPPAAERGKGAHYGRGYKNFGRNWVLCKCLFSRFADTMNKNVKVPTIAKETI